MAGGGIFDKDIPGELGLLYTAFQHDHLMPKQSVFGNQLEFAPQQITRVSSIWGVLAGLVLAIIHFCTLCQIPEP